MINPLRGRLTGPLSTLFGLVLVFGSGQDATPAASGQVACGTNLSTVVPAAGSVISLLRGCTYAGTLTVSASNVTVNAYGTGVRPLITRSARGSDIKVSGTGDKITGLHLAGVGYSRVCGARTAGYELGIDVTGSYDSFTNLRLTGDLYAGIYLETSATGALISGSTFDGIDALNPQDLSSGAFGVLVWGSGNAINGNSFINETTCSPDYGTDGSGVEIYHGTGNVISANTGSNDAAFTELGGAGATGNSYVQNTFTASTADQSFLVTRGSGDKADGPVTNTSMTGDTVIEMAKNAEGVISYDYRAGDPTLLLITGSTVTVPRGTAIDTDGGYVDGGGNTFTGKVIPARPRLRQGPSRTGAPGAGPRPGRSR
jgi:hypothetical protein